MNAELEPSPYHSNGPDRIREGIGANAIRDLIEIGKPAVPKLMEELDHTQREPTMRTLAFVLRGIGDPRSVPALIRAIPFTMQPGYSDFGLAIKDDPELQQFMQDHQNDPQYAFNGCFNYQRPIREVFAALNKITGEKKWEMELNFVFRSKEARRKGGFSVNYFCG